MINDFFAVPTGFNEIKGLNIGVRMRSDISHVIEMRSYYTDHDVIVEW